MTGDESPRPSGRSSGRLPAERLVAAHRGAGLLAPENTLSAFAAALDRGAAALELDVHLSADDRVVVVHDPRVDRTTDGEGAVRSLTTEQLGRLNAGAWFGPAFAGERIPTLEEVLALTDGRARLTVELKSSPRDVEHVIEAVCRHGAADRVLLMSFDLGAVLAAKRVATSPAWRDEAGDIPVLPIVVEPVADPLGLVTSTGLDGLNYPPQHWDAELIERFRDRGLLVHGGLINDAATLQRFFASGGQLADSDDPELYRR